MTFLTTRPPALTIRPSPVTTVISRMRSRVGPYRASSISGDRRGQHSADGRSSGRFGKDGGLAASRQARLEIRHTHAAFDDDGHVVWFPGDQAVEPGGGDDEVRLDPMTETLVASSTPHEDLEPARRCFGQEFGQILRARWRRGQISASGRPGTSAFILDAMRLMPALIEVTPRHPREACRRRRSTASPAAAPCRG